MTDREKNIAIAEWCGWKRETRKQWAGVYNVAGWGFNTHLSLGSPDRKFTAYGDFPDYCNDLSTIHAAEEMIEGWSLQYNYCYQLGLIVGSQNLGAIHATASQRAEALLKTIGKWKE